MRLRKKTRVLSIVVGAALIPVFLLLFTLDPSILAAVSGWYGYLGTPVVPEAMSSMRPFHGVKERNNDILAPNGDIIQYLNGVIKYEADGISVPSVGFAFSHRPTYNNNFEGGTLSYNDGNANLPNGWNWHTGLFQLVQTASNEYRVFGRATASTKYSATSSPFPGKMGADADLVANTGTKEMVLRATNGTQVTFYDFDSSHGDKFGACKKIVDAAGNTLTADYYTSGNLLYLLDKVTDKGNHVYTYNYINSPGATNHRKIQQVSLSDGTNTLATSTNTFYDSTAGSGSFATGSGSNGDLMKITVAERDSSGQLNIVRSTLFRYYTGSHSGSNPGAAHKLKYIVGPQSYVELDAAVSNPLTATDGEVAAHADYFFEYDADGFVTKATVRGAGCSSCSGAAGTFTYAYSATNGSWTQGSFNVWKRRVTQTNPDGTVRIVDVNEGGSIINDIFQEDADWSTGDERWITHYTFDSAGRVTEIYSPSACLDYNYSTHETAIDTTGGGLIRLYAYDTNGNLTDVKLKNANAATQYWIAKTEYTSTTLGSHTVYHPWKQHSFPQTSTDGSGGKVTTFGRTYYPSSFQVKELTVTHPAVATSENGANASDVEHKYYFDTYGQFQWEKDELGLITYREYDSALGRITKVSVDVDTTSLSPPSGYENGGGTNLETIYGYLDTGKIETIEDSEGRIETYHYTYLQTGHPVTLEYPHYDGEATIGPVMISVFDFDGKLITRAKGAPESGDPEDDLLEAYGTLETAFVGELFERTEYVYAHGQKTEEHMWTAAGSGTAEKYITKFGYDEMGRLARVKDAAGTITRTYYTLQGRVAERQVGLNDYVEGDDLGEETGPNTMTTVEEFIYDEGASGGDGNLTTVKRYVDGSTSRDTVFVYDWRNRQEKVNGEDPYFERRDYDNMNRVTARYRYDTSDTGTLLSKFETKYDSRGRKYQTLIHYVSSGTIYNALTTDFWYDGRGKLIKSREPSGLFRKIEYDAAGRELRTFVSYDTDETAYADAGGITGDTVVEQRDYERDRVGNVLLETRWERLATGDTPGSLTTSSAVAYYTASWYDTVYRVVAVANYGTEEPELPSDPDELDRDELLVTSYSYNAAGHVEDIQGPSFVAAEPLAMPPTPAMHFTRREYDNLGRLTATTDNYVNGTAGPGAEDRRQVLTYDALSRVTHRKTWMSSSESQETEYVYGVTQDPGQGDPVEASLIDSKGLLKLIKYPDPDAGEGQGLPSEDEEDQEAFAYNAQGEIIWRKDQNGIVHEFTYDELGRRTADAVTTNPLPEGVIADVLRIGTTFDALDRVKKVTSYDAASGGDVENEVELVYNSIGQVLASKQEHNGAVTGSTLQVEYNYVAGGSPDPTNRLLYIKYPGTNRIVYFHYDQATGTDHEKMDWILMRPSAVSNYSSSSADRLADYTYEGLRRVRSRDNAEPSTDIGIDYSYDRFGRPEYITAASSSTINSLRYGYNRDSQVLWREESAGNVSGKDERYTYDDLDRLDTFERGDLNSGKTGLTGTAVRNQDWTLDLLGNWDTIASTQPASSTESRDHNRSNEITDVSIGGSGDEPSYDKNGNTTAIDEPAPAVLSYTYDAWNRLAKVAFGGTVLAVYRYDGFGRRIQNSQVSRSYYYSEGWQLLSERGGSDPAREYVWGLRYIDEIVERSEDANGDGDTRDAGEMGDASLFYIQDRNWNVHTVCDESGDPVERVLYDPYGIPKFYNGTWGSASDYSAYSNTVLFTGRLWNATSRTYCVRHREQSPYLGRFLQGDPIGTPIVFTPHVKNAKAAHGQGSGATRRPSGTRMDLWVVTQLIVLIRLDWMTFS